MSVSKKILIIGPGLLGWNVLEFMVQEGHYVTAIVRSQEQISPMRSSGAIAVVGDLNDQALITRQATEHDVIIHLASADHLPSVEAILRGIAHRTEDGQDTIYIHTSGTSILNDGAAGRYLGEKIFHDDTAAEIDSVADDAPHREIDLTILRRRKEFGDKARLAIMIPPLIYGINPRHNRLSIQVPTLVRFALKHGFSGYVGDGRSAESQVHVLDLARAYVFVLKYCEKATAQELKKNPYFFCENGHESSWLQVAQHIGESLHAAGKIKTSIPRPIPKHLCSDLFGAFTDVVLGMNSRSRAVRLRALGWQPREPSIWESYQLEELPILLQEDVSQFRGYAGNAAAYTFGERDGGRAVVPT